MPNERTCPRCGPGALVLNRPRFEGLRKTGERALCAACGCDLGPAEEPAGEASGPRPPPPLFAGDRPPPPPDPFDGGSAGRTCRRCRHYVLNPFRQWCGRNRREVGALDSCAGFEPPPEPSP